MTTLAYAVRNPDGTWMHQLDHPGTIDVWLVGDVLANSLRQNAHALKEGEYRVIAGSANMDHARRYCKHVSTIMPEDFDAGWVAYRIVAPPKMHRPDAPTERQLLAKFHALRRARADSQAFFDLARRVETRITWSAWSESWHWHERDILSDHTQSAYTWFCRTMEEATP
jgi:hypothetical protein